MKTLMRNYSEKILKAAPLFLGGYAGLSLAFNKGFTYLHVWIDGIPLFITEVVLAVSLVGAGVVLLGDSESRNRFRSLWPLWVLAGLFFVSFLFAFGRLLSSPFELELNALKRAALGYYSLFLLAGFFLFPKKEDLVRFFDLAVVGAAVCTFLDVFFLFVPYPRWWPVSVGIAAESARALLVLYAVFGSESRWSPRIRTIAGSLALAIMFFTSIRSVILVLVVLAPFCLAAQRLFLAKGPKLSGSRFSLTTLAALVVLFILSGPPPFMDRMASEWKIGGLAQSVKKVLLQSRVGKEIVDSPGDSEPDDSGDPSPLPSSSPATPKGEETWKKIPKWKGLNQEHVEAGPMTERQEKKVFLEKWITGTSIISGKVPQRAIEIIMEDNPPWDRTCAPFFEPWLGFLESDWLKQSPNTWWRANVWGELLFQLACGRWFWGIGLEAPLVVPPISPYSVREEIAVATYLMKYQYDFRGRLMKEDPSEDVKPVWPMAPQTVPDIYTPHWYNLDPHNSHLAILYRFGLVGFAGYAGLGLLLMFWLFQLVTRGDFMALFLLSAAAWYAGVSFFNVVLEGPFMGAFFWILLGVGASYVANNRKVKR